MKDRTIFKGRCYKIKDIWRDALKKFKYKIKFQYYFIKHFLVYNFY